MSKLRSDRNCFTNPTQGYTRITGPVPRIPLQSQLISSVPATIVVNHAPVVRLSPVGPQSGLVQKYPEHRGAFVHRPAINVRPSTSMLPANCVGVTPPCARYAGLQTAKPGQLILAPGAIRIVGNPMPMGVANPLAMGVANGGVAVGRAQLVNSNPRVASAVLVGRDSKVVGGASITGGGQVVASIQSAQMHATTSPAAILNRVIGPALTLGAPAPVVQNLVRPVAPIHIGTIGRPTAVPITIGTIGTLVRPGVPITIGSVMRPPSVVTSGITIGPVIKNPLVRPSDLIRLGPVISGHHRAVAPVAPPNIVAAQAKVVGVPMVLSQQRVSKPLEAKNFVGWSLAY